MPMLGEDRDFRRFLDFVEHERDKIDRGLGVVDLGFYDRENRSIGEVVEWIGSFKDPMDP